MACALVLLTGYQTLAALCRCGQARLARWLATRGVRHPDTVAATALTAAHAQHVILPGQDMAAHIAADLAQPQPEDLQPQPDQVIHTPPTAWSNDRQGRGMNEQRLSETTASKYLISTLTTLAADASNQIAWLDRYRLETDDLALDYENAKGAISVLAEAGRIDAVMESHLARIDVILDTMSGPEHAARWTYEALTTDSDG